MTIQAKLEIIEWIDELQNLVQIQTTDEKRTEKVLYADASENGIGVYIKQAERKWTVLSLPLPHEFNNELWEVNSTAREVIGIKKGLEHIQANDDEKLKVLIFCDNEPSSYQIETMRTQNQKTRDALTSIQKLTAERDITIKWSWHRRTTKTAKFTDLLSKEKHLIPKEKIQEKIWEKFERSIKNILEDTKLIKQLWRFVYIPKKLSERITENTLLFIHPDISTKIIKKKRIQGDFYFR